MTMNTRIKLMLLCLFVNTITAEADVPTRDYKTVNFDNGITSRILEIGATSVTFSVESSLGVTIPDKVVMVGKLNMDWEAWNFWGEMKVVQKDGRATVEYRYSRFSDLEPEATMFAQKAFFSVQIFVSDEEWERTWGADGYGKEGIIEPPINAPPVATTELEIQGKNFPVKNEIWLSA